MWIFLAFFNVFFYNWLYGYIHLLLLVSLCFTLFCAGWAVATATNARLVPAFWKISRNILWKGICQKRVQVIGLEWMRFLFSAVAASNYVVVNFSS